MKKYSLAVWITGLSASGKTTLANVVADRLRERGIPLIMLDGDNLREILGETVQYEREDRKNLAFVYARMVQSLSKQGVVVVIATVALFREVHEWNRKNIQGYFEVFLDVPFDELRRRDPKQIYKRFDEGKIKNVAGLDFSIDPPLAPDVRFAHDSNVTPEMNANILLDELAAFIDAE
jgi:cytidine diphosphoramidate kinase